MRKNFLIREFTTQKEEKKYIYNSEFKKQLVPEGGSFYTSIQHIFPLRNVPTKITNFKNNIPKGFLEHF